MARLRPRDMQKAFRKLAQTVLNKPSQKPRRTRCMACRRLTDTNAKGGCAGCGFPKTEF